MNIRSPYKSILILSAILGIACLGAWGFVAYKAFSFRGGIATLSAQAQSALARDSKTLSIKSALRDSRADVALIDARFVTKDGIPAFIDLLEEKAAEAGMKAELDSINLDQSLRIHVVSSGSWTSAVTYISILESMPYAISIDNLSIAKADSASSRWNMSLDLSVLIAPNK